MTGRLDIKIVVILLVTVLLPLGVSVLLVMGAVDTSLGLGLNDEVASELEKTLEVHQKHTKGLKLGIEHRFALLADSHRLSRAAKEGDEAAVREVLVAFIREDPAIHLIRLTHDNGRILEVSASTEDDGSGRRPFRREANIDVGP